MRRGIGGGGGLLRFSHETKEKDMAICSEHNLGCLKR